MTVFVILGQLIFLGINKRLLKKAVSLLMELKSLASLLLPKGLLDKFEVRRIEELGNIKSKKLEYHIWLDENNTLPLKYKDYESKGFYPSKVIQDFPIRGKALFLHIRRRRWRDKKGLQPDIKSDFSFIARGVKLTEELAIFLKGGSTK